MQSSLSLSISAPSSSAIPRSNNSIHKSLSLRSSKPINLRFCGLRREVFGLPPLKRSESHQVRVSQSNKKVVVSAVLSDNGSPPKSFDYDLLIIGAGVGGHGAALHAVEKVRALFFAVFET